MKNKNLESKKNIGVAQELDENNLGAVSGGRGVYRKEDWRRHSEKLSNSKKK